MNLNEFEKCFNEIDRNDLEKLKKIVHDSNHVVILGNGGSNAISCHIAQDYTKMLGKKAICFGDSSRLTCYANDYGFENWIVKTIENYYNKGDLVILISASGRSKNIVNAAKYCILKKKLFFSLSGFGSKTPLRKLSYKNIFVDSKSFNIIEILHLYILIQIIDLFKGKIEYSNKF